MLRIALDPSGTPFVAYIDWANGKRVTVMKVQDGDWVHVGQPGFSAGEADGIQLTIDRNGVPFVAFTEEANGGKVSVMRFLGGTWERVGQNGISGNDAESLSLAVDAQGTAYVAYNDNTNGGKGTVKKFDGNNWEDISLSGLTDRRATAMKLAVDTQGTPYVAFLEAFFLRTDIADYYRVSAKKFNGSQWEYVGKAGFSSDTDLVTLSVDAAYINLVIDEKDTPFVAYQNLENDKATVKKFNGSAWEYVGNKDISPDRADYVSLSLDSSGNPFLAFMDYAHGQNATVMKFPAAPAIVSHPSSSSVEGGQSVRFSVGATSEEALTYQWQVSKDGGAHFEDLLGGAVYSGTTSPTLIIAPAQISMHTYAYRAKVSNGNIAYTQAATLSVTAPEFDNTLSWQPVGGAGLSVRDAGFTSTAVDANGTVYIAYAEAYHGNRAVVKKYVNQSWVSVGTFASGGQVEQVELALDANGNPVLAYQDALNGNRTTVVKHTGSNWAYVGTPGFSTGTPAKLNLALSSNGQPYVAFQDGPGGSGVRVMTYNGSSWITVGTSTVGSGQQAEFIDLKLDARDIPYVTFKAGTDGFVTDVGAMRLHGSEWEPVGFFSAFGTKVKDVALDIDAEGTLYLAYWGEDNYMSEMFKPTLLRFNHTGWVELASAGTYSNFTGLTPAIELALDKSGVPYIAFLNETEGKIRVKRFNGTAWANVSSLGMQQGETRYTSLSVDHSGTILLGFSDGSRNFQATVMRYAGALPATPAAPATTGAARCGTGTLTLTASGAKENESYRWYTASTGGTAIPAATGNSYATPVLESTTTFYVSIVNGESESIRTAVTATINPLPAAPVVTPAVSYCQGDTPLTLEATGSNLKWYTESTGGTAMASPPTPLTSAVGATDYYVSQTIGACEGPRAKITVTVRPQPTVSFDAREQNICSNIDNFVLTGGVPAGGEYAGPGVSNGVFNATVAGIGTHTISYTYSADGCSATATQTITVGTCTALEERQVAKVLTVYPNPASGRVTVSLPIAKTTRLALQLLDLRGQVVQSTDFGKVSTDFNHTLDLKGLAKGIYLLKVIVPDGVMVRRLILE
ncbi:MAG: T9SS type A sorting domain-containing protein [Hymenobacteraceae bacterium]|nr:T9SS type A sorting domain-containing protein [Hymenobacteraceae bacterium]